MKRTLRAMLDVIGVESVEELIAQVIPQSIRLKKPLALPAEGMSEYEFAAHIRALADRNRTLRSFIGMGWYPCAVPAAVARNVFENPAWYTSYTPYQAEISQGRLEALLNFQTALISLTGMEIGNCSLLDEGTAAAEAMLMMFALRSREAVKEGRNQLFVDRNLFPQTLDVLLTRSEPFGIELIIDEYDEYEFTGREFGAIVQYPAADGTVRDYGDFTAAAPRQGGARDGRGRPAGAGAAQGSGRMGRRHRRGLHPAPRHPDGLRRSERRLHDHPRGLQAQHAGTHHRRLGRPPGQPRPAHGATDARAAHQARARHVEHLHGLGAHGLDGGFLLRLQRSRGAAPRRRGRPIWPPRPSPGLSGRWTTNSPRRSSSTRWRSRPKRPSCSRWRWSRGSTSSTPRKGRCACRSTR